MRYTFFFIIIFKTKASMCLNKSDVHASKQVMSSPYIGFHFEISTETTLTFRQPVLHLQTVKRQQKAIAVFMEN